MELGPVSLLGMAVSRIVFRGSCWLNMALGSLSANEWACVSILLVNIWPEAFQH